MKFGLIAVMALFLSTISVFADEPTQHELANIRAEGQKKGYMTGEGYMPDQDSNGAGDSHAGNTAGRMRFPGNPFENSDVGRTVNTTNVHEAITGNANSIQVTNARVKNMGASGPLLYTVGNLTDAATMSAAMHGFLESTTIGAFDEEVESSNLKKLKEAGLGQAEMIQECIRKEKERGKGQYEYLRSCFPTNYSLDSALDAPTIDNVMNICGHNFPDLPGIHEIAKLGAMMYQYYRWHPFRNCEWFVANAASTLPVIGGEDPGPPLINQNILKFANGVSVVTTLTLRHAVVDDAIHGLADLPKNIFLIKLRKAFIKLFGDRFVYKAAYDPKLDPGDAGDLIEIGRQLLNASSQRVYVDVTPPEVTREAYEDLTATEIFHNINEQLKTRCLASLGQKMHLNALWGSGVGEIRAGAADDMRDPAKYNAPDLAYWHFPLWRETAARIDVDGVEIDRGTYDAFYAMFLDEHYVRTSSPLTVEECETALDTSPGGDSNLELVRSRNFTARTDAIYKLSRRLARLQYISLAMIALDLSSAFTQGDVDREIRQQAEDLVFSAMGGAVQNLDGMESAYNEIADKVNDSTNGIKLSSQMRGTRASGSFTGTYDAEDTNAAGFGRQSNAGGSVGN